MIFRIQMKSTYAIIHLFVQYTYSNEQKYTKNTYAMKHYLKIFGIFIAEY